MSLGLVVLEKKLFTRMRTRTPTLQSDDIMSADIKSMTLNRGLPQISIQVNLMSLGLYRLDLKNMQIEANTK